jgi:protein tyrosine phosphatase (PTP) superfamily phosphohydrolase (DUF442 family)
MASSVHLSRRFTKTKKYTDEKELCESNGLAYAHSPFTVPLTLEAGQQALTALQGLPTPAYVHCATKGRASIVVFNELAKDKKGEELANAIRALATEHGLAYPPALENYLALLKA